MTDKIKETEHLERTLKPIHLWALAVGLVISGNYFGWSYGYGTGGPVGLFIACIPVVIFYATFIFCYSEMATMIPHAGGPSAYARRAMGPVAGYFAGISCLIEFLFAPPAIALAVGGYIHNLIPIVPAIPATIVAFIFFVFINFLGMHTSAVFELIVTVVALVGLCIFWAAAVPHFEMSSFLQPLAENNGFSGFMSYVPNGWGGVMASVPFAIWLYLALEGGAMAAEEMVDPQKDIPKGFLSGMLTLFIMMCFTIILTAGIVDYNTISAVDFPLPAALEAVYGKGILTIAVNFLGLFGLIASLNGIIVGSSRQLFAMARTGYLPKIIATVNHKRHTPTAALIIAGIIGILAATTGLTSVVIIISVFGSGRSLLHILDLLFRTACERTGSKKTVQSTCRQARRRNQHDHVCLLSDQFIRYDGCTSVTGIQPCICSIWCDQHQPIMGDRNHLCIGIRMVFRRRKKEYQTVR